MIFQFNQQLQAGPSHPLQCGPGRRRPSEQSSGSKGGDASQDLRPLRLRELEEAASSDRWSLIISGTILGALQAEGERLNRCLFNCDHHFYDDDGEMSMDMIVTTKEGFQQKI